MVNISDELKAALLADGSHKELTVFIPDLDKTYTNNNIVLESIKLEQSVMASDSLEFVGCIASSFEIKINNISDNAKGKKIVVSMMVDDIPETILLFTGIVDSVKSETDSTISTVVAYDMLYSASQNDWTDKYNNHSETSVEQLLYEVLFDCGITPSPDLVVKNGGVTAFCGTKRKGKSLAALDLIKQVCQLAGGFGSINAAGRFNIIYITDDPTVNLRYPATNIYPSGNIYPDYLASEDDPRAVVPFYEYCRYEGYKVNKINKVEIRDSEKEEEPASYGSGKNKYIIQGNIFCYDQTKETKVQIAHRIYSAVANITYTPFEAKNNGMPWLECGDELVYYDINDKSKKRNFFVFSRSLTGIQFLQDLFSADGEQNQKIFITDLQAQIDDIKDDTYSKEEADEIIDELREDMLDAYAVPNEPPSDWKRRTIYFIYEEE